MNGFDTVRAELAGKLTAAGLEGVTLDPVANVPFVLVDAPEMPDSATGIGAWPVSFPVRVVVPPPGDAAALSALLDRLEVIYRTLGYATGGPDTYDVAGQICPAYTVTYPRNVPNPDC